MFDLLILGRSPLDSILYHETIQLFTDIFSSNEIIKIGWDFNKNDTKKLISSGIRDPQTKKGI